MRNILLKAAPLFACAMLLMANNGGCNIQTFINTLRGAEAKAAAVVQKIKAGIAVANADIDEAATVVCSKLGAADDALVAIRLRYPNPGPKTTAYLNAAGVELSKITTYCAGPHNVRTTLRLAWDGIQTAISAINAADAAAGK